MPRTMAPASSSAWTLVEARIANRGRAVKLAGETVSRCRHDRSQSSSSLRSFFSLDLIQER